MFRRARLSVKPNVRPGVGARGSTALNPQRGHETPRPPEPEPAAPSTPKPAESTDVTLVDFKGAEPQEKAPRSSDEKTDGENDVQESSKSSSTASQRRKGLSSTSSPVKPNDNVPLEPCPLLTANQETQQPNPVPTKEKQPCSDRYRIYKAQKLREMLREELRKEKKQWKQKFAINESQRLPDRSKMTMRDFIYYLPDSNPMASSLEQEKKIEKPLTAVHPREQEGKNTPNAEDHEEIEEPDDGPLLVPRVKVAEDGSIILDEESLTVEVLRTKGPCVVEENDPIFERGSTTTYSSFRKNYYSKPWSNKETDMFFLAISMVGTDFSMIGQLFPHRERIEIKNKFKREEKTNGWRIDKAFQEKRPFDFDFFAHLLQKVLAEEEKRKQKSVKSQNLQEKKPSKPRKNVKAKKVATEAVNDDSDESVSSKIPDMSQSQKDAQSVEEHSPTLSEQDSEQIASEPNLNQNKRRKKNQNEVGELEVRNHSESATVQPDPSQGEMQKNNCESLRPEVNEVEDNKQKELPCIQDTDDIVDLFPSEKTEKRTDRILSASHQDVLSVGDETLESSPSDLLSSEVEITTLCEVTNAKSISNKESNVDMNIKILETNQIENVKPALRGRRQRLKPNLSRAGGKKLVLTQDQADAESKSLHPETALEKDSMEKDKMNTNISGMENTEGENPDAETVSNSSERICLPQDEQPKTFNPARQRRGRLLRPEPNVGKAVEQKETRASQGKKGTNVENNENESCVSRDSPEQIEYEPCKIFDCQDITSQPEKNDTFQNMPTDEPEALNECPKKTRFRKPKPNLGRGTGRRKVFSKEELPVETLPSEKMTGTSRQETLLKEQLSVEADTAEDMELDLKESGSCGIIPVEETPEMIYTTVLMETDLKESRRERCPVEKITDVSEAIEEREAKLKETGKKEVPPQENSPERANILGVAETSLKETEKEISPREKGPVETSAIGERKSLYNETGKRETSLMEELSEKVTDTEKIEADLAETFPRENVLVGIDSTREKEIKLNETAIRDTSLMEKPSEMVTDIVETEADLKGTSPRGELLVGISAFREKEITLNEASVRDTSQLEKASEMVTDIREAEADLKETSPREELPEGVSAVGEKITFHESATRETSLLEKTLEMLTNIEETEANLKGSPQMEELPEEVSVVGEKITLNESAIRDTSLMEKAVEIVINIEKTEADLKLNPPREELLEGISAFGDKEITLNESASRDNSFLEKTSEMVTDIEKIEADLKETSPRKELPVGLSVFGKKETALNEAATRDTSLLEKTSEVVMDTEVSETDLKETSPRKELLVGVTALGEKETIMNEVATRDTSLLEKTSVVVMDTEVTETDLNGTSPRKEFPVAISALGEKETTLNEVATRDTSLLEKTPEVVMDTEVTEADLKETSPRKELPVGISALEEKETTLNEAIKRDTSLWEKTSEVVMDTEVTEVDLKETFPRKELPVGLSVFGEKETTLNEVATGDTTLLEKTSEVVMDTEVSETDLKETPRKELLVGVTALGEKETILNEAATRDTSLLEKTSEVVMDTEVTETDLKETFPRKELPVGLSVFGEEETTLSEAATRDTSLWEKTSEVVMDTEVAETDLKETFPRKELPVGLSVFGEEETTLSEAPTRDTSLLEKTSEVVMDTEVAETDLKETFPRKELLVGVSVFGEKETTLNEASTRDTSLLQKTSEVVMDTEVTETDLKETSPRKELLVGVSVFGEKETTLNEVATRDTSLWEKTPKVVMDTVVIKTDLKETSPRKEVPVGISALEEKETTLNEAVKRDTSLWEKSSEVVMDTEVTEVDLKETFPRKELPVGLSVFGEKETTLNEVATRDTTLLEKTSEVVMDTEVSETDLKETSPRKELLVGATALGEKETIMNEVATRDTSLLEKTSELVMDTVVIKTDLKETSPKKELLVGVTALGEKETILNEVATRDTSLLEKTSEVVIDTEVTETDLKETSPMKGFPVGMSVFGEETTLDETATRDTSVLEKTSEVVMDTEVTETDMKGTSPRKELLVDLSVFGEEENEVATRNTSLLEKISEVVMDTEVTETDLKETSPRKELLVGVSAFGEEETTLNEAATRHTSLLEKISEVVTGIEETETDLKETSPRKELLVRVSAFGDKEITLNESAKRDISLLEKASEMVTDIEETEADLKECSLREELGEGISAIGDKITFNETATRDTSLMEKTLEMVTDFEETMAGLKETVGNISLIKDTLEEIRADEEMMQDMKQTGNINISLRENEPEETGTSRQTETDLMHSSCGDCNTVSPPDVKNVSGEVLPIVQKSIEEKNSEKEVSSPLQTFEHDEMEDQGRQFPDISNTSLSKSLPQEQKPFEVKPTPFMRSRFKRPKPNLTRATLKRPTVEPKKYVIGKKLEIDETETIVTQQNNEQMNTLPSQPDVTSVMTSKEKDNSGQKQEEAVTLPYIQTEKDLEEEAQSTQAQEKAYSINTSPQEMKGNIIPTALPRRGQLQRPRPNIRKIGQRQIVEQVEAKVTIEEERNLEKEETEKESLTMANSQIGNDIEVVSSKISECSVNDVLDEKIRQEHKTHTLRPPQLIRRQFQKAKPNLGRARVSKKENPCLEKNRAYQSETKKPEDNVQQQGDCDSQLLQKEKTEFLTSLEVSARAHVGSKEDALAKRVTPSEGEPLGSDVEKTVGDSSTSSVAEEQYLSKLKSCPQLLKEPNYSKINLDQRTTISSASESKIVHSERRTHRKIKPNATRGRGSKRARSKTSKKETRPSKPMLVTLRASQEEDEDEDEDYEPDYEDEIYHLAPEEVNKAPVFVPVGLRSPEPVPVRIQETMEELEITVNAPDVECIAIVEPQFSNTDVTTQEMKPEADLNALQVELTPVEHTQDETGTNDGSTEAAITLLTMGDLVLQSEIDTDQGDGIWILPDVHSKDESHIPFSLGHVEHRIAHECQELSLPVNSASLASLEENQIVLEEQNIKGEVGLMEKLRENSLSTRNTTYEVTNNLTKRSRFDAQEVPSLFVAQEEEIHSETQENAFKTNLDDKILGLDTVGDNKEQHQLTSMHNIEEASSSQASNLTERNEGQIEGPQEVQIFSVDPIILPSTFSSARNLGENIVEEPLNKNSSEDSLLKLPIPKGIPTSIPDVQKEDVINSQDLAVANVDEADEDEHTFILTLVEIPADAVEFTDSTTQLMPNTLLPAPILVKSVNAEERANMRLNFPVTSFSQDALCLSSYEKGDSEQPPANVDVISRKRIHSELDERESDPASPAKKRSLISSDAYQTYTSEVCSKESVNAIEMTGVSSKGQGTFPTSGSTLASPESQKEQSETSAFQSIETKSLDDEVIDTHREKNTFQLLQDKEERTCSASKSEQMGSKTSSSKTPLTRPGRRPLGFLSLICSKNSLESDEPTLIRSKKRLKPHIPMARQNLKRSNLLNENQEKNQESSDLPSPNVVSTQSETTSHSTTQVSRDRSLPKEECKSGQKQVTGEELNTISEYFFNDIFIEVNEPE
ncbi:transcription factor TFIIIB component B'' homolog isoform X2 [Erinaceus europaeus]|uniref:Transcription factor TFIIIB component B'' homolog isoform X2 n=1 Tax=Erinaceus europaeus TaxID=9365 RepID=A0ABM3XEG0_ERIEU|nr:transcription factor TFIIIB component B'' homolog isoform X2 [Erinaceus europaeus]